MRWFFSAVLFSLLTAFSGVNNSHIVKNYQVHGIDVSHHQQHIQWDKVVTHPALKVSFCFIKATEGATFKDHRFHLNWAGSKKAGLSRGAYHFYISAGNPKAQAMHFIRQVKLESGDLAPVLDIEQDTNEITAYQLRKNIKTWLTTVERHFGIKPIIYTNPFIYNKYIKGYFKDYPLWIADYNSGNIHKTIKDSNLKFWQNNGHSRVCRLQCFFR